MKNAIKLMTGLLAITLNLGAVSPKPSATIDRIEDNIATVEVAREGEIQMFNIPAVDFNEEITEGSRIAIIPVKGKFHGSLDDIEGTIYYQFRSYDNEVWWLLTEEQIGHIPGEGEYTLIYCNNGTIDCEERITLDCECYKYDDLFLGVWE